MDVYLHIIFIYLNITNKDNHLWLCVFVLPVAIIAPWSMLGQTAPWWLGQTSIQEGGFPGTNMMK